MNDFEDRLREALERIEPPPGFAERVIARVPRRAAVRNWFRYAAAVAAMLIVGCSALLYQHHRAVERQRAEMASRQALFALRFTAMKLEQVTHRITKSSPAVNIGGTFRGRS
jgi:hypothetical protein